MTKLRLKHISLLHNSLQAILNITLPWLRLHQSFLPEVGPLWSQYLRCRPATQRLVIMPRHQFGGAPSLHIGLAVSATVQLEWWTILSRFQIDLIHLFNLWWIHHSKHLMLLHITAWKIFIEEIMVYNSVIIDMILHLLLLSFSYLSIQEASLVTSWYSGRIIRLSLIQCLRLVVQVFAH